MLHILFHHDNELRAFSIDWPDGPKHTIPYRVRECATLIVRTNDDHFPAPIKDRLGVFSYTSLQTMDDVEEWLADVGLAPRKGTERDRLRKLIDNAPPGEAVKIPRDVVAWLQNQVNEAQPKEN